MKKIFVFILMLCCTMAQADERSGKVLGRMASVIKGYKQYRVEFALKPDPTVKGITGSYTVSGDRYRISIEGNEVICDGKVKYEISEANKEVLADKVDPNDMGVLSNPTKVFDFPDAHFTHSYGGTTTYAGKACETITLRPKDKESPMESVTLVTETATGLPVALNYRMEGVSVPVAIDIKSVKPLAQPDEALFRFDKAKYKGYEIIDFR